MTEVIPGVPVMLWDSWTAQAACRDHDPELFFPEGKYPEGRPETGVAKAICAGCPVIDKCLEYALTHPAAAAFGIWGGLLPDERLAVRSRRRALH
jgi:WhiB family transcriptional regulator, redox-sensing transcriptional regulator